MKFAVYELSVCCSVGLESYIVKQISKLFQVLKQNLSIHQTMTFPHFHFLLSLLGTLVLSAFANLVALDSGWISIPNT